MDGDGPSPLHRALDLGRAFRSKHSTTPRQSRGRDDTVGGQRGDVNVIHRGTMADVFLLPRLLSKHQSQELVRIAEDRMGFEAHTSLGPARGEAYRQHGRIQVWDEKFAQRLWEETGLNGVMKDIRIDGRKPVGLHPKVRIYRYQVGERFGKHMDDHEELGNGKRTQYTLLIYLTGGPEIHQAEDIDQPKDACAKRQRNQTKKDVKWKSGGGGNRKGQPGNRTLLGGETVFYNNRGKILASVAPTCGTALLHLHGEHCLEHEAKPVLQGMKYVLRSDVIFQ